MQDNPPPQGQGHDKERDDADLFPEVNIKGLDYMKCKYGYIDTSLLLPTTYVSTKPSFNVY